MLAMMVTVDEQQFSIVKWEGFRGFASAYLNFFKHVSRFTIARNCMKLYVYEWTSLKNKLSSLKSSIALTTNIWSSIQNLSYLCPTNRHLIVDDWKLHKRLLNFIVISGHKSKEINTMVDKCITNCVLEIVFLAQLIMVTQMMWLWLLWKATWKICLFWVKHFSIWGM